MNNITDIVIIVDQSGSMSTLQNDTIGGINSVIENQRKEEGRANLTLVFFNSNSRVIHDSVDLKEVPLVTDKDYMPYGGTGLLDAVGNTVHKVLLRKSRQAAEERASKTIFVIITDGEENASTKYSRSDIADTVEYTKALLGWDFLFLGANIDSFREASSIGISSQNTGRFSASSAGVSSMYSSVNNSLLTYRNTGEVTYTGDLTVDTPTSK